MDGAKLGTETTAFARTGKGVCCMCRSAVLRSHGACSSENPGVSNSNIRVRNPYTGSTRISSP